jgi:hypothetical protein
VDCKELDTQGGQMMGGCKHKHCGEGRERDAGLCKARRYYWGRDSGACGLQIVLEEQGDEMCGFKRYERGRWKVRACRRVIEGQRPEGGGA